MSVLLSCSRASLELTDASAAHRPAQRAKENPTPRPIAAVLNTLILHLYSFVEIDKGIYAIWLATSGCADSSRDLLINPQKYCYLWLNNEVSEVNIIISVV